MGLQFGSDRVSGNHHGQVNDISQVDGDSDTVPTCASRLSWGTVQERTMASASTFAWERAAPPAPALKPNNSVPQCMSLIPFKLMPQRWSSEQVHQQVHPCAGHLRGTPETPAAFRLSHNLCRLSLPKLWGLLFVALEPQRS